MRYLLSFALFCVACSGGSESPDGAAMDMAAPADDLSAPVDAMNDFASTMQPTGAPCTAPTDCAGAGAGCISMRNGVSWPGGYCSSACQLDQGDMKSALTCPGNAVCLGQSGATTGGCLATCAAGSCRSGYSCFTVGGNAVCLPTALSKCDPAVAGSCDLDGGVPDAGLQTCLRAGPDPVGECVAGCHPLTQDCAMTAQACYGTRETGDGVCTNPGTVAAGGACTASSECANGLGCHVENGAGVCRAWCSTSVVCTTSGQSCHDLSATVPASVLGLCGP